MKNIVICFSLLLLGCKSESKIEISKKEAITQKYLPDLDILFESFNTVDSTKTHQEFANKLFKSNRDFKSSELYVYSTWMYNQAKMPDSALIMINRAIDQGMSNPNILGKLEIDTSNESQLSLNTSKRLDSIRNSLSKVENFSIETKALEQFWQYLESAKKDTSNTEAIFKEFIFKGPKEIKDYYVIRYGNLNNIHKQIIKNAPEYYTYLKSKFSKDSVNALKERITNWMKNFGDLYPEAVFPKVFIVPGLLNSGGTTSEMGLFVGGDMFAKSDLMPTEGLNEWQKNAIAPISEMPSLIIHELMHFQQNYTDNTNSSNVLGAIFKEGVCDFLVELSTGILLQNENVDFLSNQENLEQVCKDFKKEKFTSDYSKWLYNGGSIKDRPHDLGYTFGYLVAKSFYNKHVNKKEAINQLLNTGNFIDIYRNSDYTHLLE